MADSQYMDVVLPLSVLRKLRSHKKSSKELSKEVDRLKLDLYKLNKSNEEFQQQNSELQGKLQNKVTACGRLEDDLLETRGKLEMTDLYVQQLQNGGEQQDANTSQQIDQLLTEKGELQAQVSQYEEAFQRVSQEREQIAKQYQEYIEQLQQQSQHLQIQINTLLAEKDELAHHKVELDARVAKLQSEHESATGSVTAVAHERNDLIGRVEKISQETTELRQKYDTQVADNNQLSRLVVEKEERIMELELAVMRMSDNQVDKEKLLESMQSDKTALSRAIAQNKQLKQQLAELQNGFVKMSNDNMEMMTTLTSETHIAKELGARLSQQEEELKDMREQLSHKDQRLQEMQRNMENISQQIEGSDIEARVREFQEQTPLIETLQKELSMAQDTINALTNQNSEFRSQMIQTSSSANDLRELEDGSNSQVQTMSASIRQLELERNQVITQLHEERSLKTDVETRYKDLQTELATQTPATLNGDVINKAQFEALQHAMKQLENKYTHAMRDKADLSDTKEQLEHIIMQLQGETDTIGEYISLYQVQRSLLRQRQVEKEHYISRLAQEREEMSDKLSQLQALVMQLLGDTHMVHDNTQTANAIGQVVANHVSPPHPGHAQRNDISGKLDSTNLEDWPDYTSSDSDSDVEQIVGGEGKERNSHHLQPHSTPNHPPSAQSSPQWDIPPKTDQTAQQIMSLLTEIGMSNLVDHRGANNSFLHCSHCSGTILNL